MGGGVEVVVGVGTSLDSVVEEGELLADLTPEVIALGVVEMDEAEGFAVDALPDGVGVGMEMGGDEAGGLEAGGEGGGGGDGFRAGVGEGVFVIGGNADDEVVGGVDVVGDAGGE